MVAKICFLVLVGVILIEANSGSNPLTDPVPVKDNNGNIVYYQLPKVKQQGKVRHPIPVKNSKGRIVYYILPRADNKGSVSISADVLAKIRPIPVKSHQGKTEYYVISRPQNQGGLLSVALEDLLKLHLNVGVNAEVNIRNLSESWEKLKAKWSEVIEKGKVEWEKIKQKGIETYEKVINKVKIMKDQGLELINKAQKTIQEFIKEGECAYVDFKNLYNVVKNAYEDLKSTGKDVFADVKDLLNELKKAAEKGEFFVQVKKIN